jgi:hypothetical protein
VKRKRSISRKMNGALFPGVGRRVDDRESGFDGSAAPGPGVAGSAGFLGVGGIASGEGGPPPIPWDVLFGFQPFTGTHPTNHL